MRVPFFDARDWSRVPLWKDVELNMHPWTFGVPARHHVAALRVVMYLHDFGIMSTTPRRLWPRARRVRRYSLRTFAL